VHFTFLRFGKMPQLRVFAGIFPEGGNLRHTKLTLKNVGLTQLTHPLNVQSAPNDFCQGSNE
jgi:hypothetical protein